MLADGVLKRMERVLTSSDTVDFLVAIWFMTIAKGCSTMLLVSEFE
jgi:hypothetical protein